jgi:hypothetical protein
MNLYHGGIMAFVLFVRPVRVDRAHSDGVSDSGRFMLRRVLRSWNASEVDNEVAHCKLSEAI